MNIGALVYGNFETVTVEGDFKIDQELLETVKKFVANKKNAVDFLADKCPGGYSVYDNEFHRLNIAIYIYKNLAELMKNISYVNILKAIQYCNIMFLVTDSGGIGDFGGDENVQMYKNNIFLIIISLSYKYINI